MRIFDIFKGSERRREEQLTDYVRDAAGEVTDRALVAKTLRSIKDKMEKQGYDKYDIKKYIESHADELVEAMSLVTQSNELLENASDIVVKKREIVKDFEEDAKSSLKKGGSNKAKTKEQKEMEALRKQIEKLTQAIEKPA